MMIWRPEQVWVADITYLPTRNGMVYLSLTTDACSRKIMGHYVHSDLRTDNVVQALKQSLKLRKNAQPLIHHSDRGIQYRSASYQSVHEKYGLICSMTDGYDCYQNTLAERVNGNTEDGVFAITPGRSGAGQKDGEGIDRHLQQRATSPVA